MTQNVQDYIKNLPLESQIPMTAIRNKLLKILPTDVVEVMSYGMPTFRFKNKNLLHYAANKNHIGFYPTPSGVQAFAKDILTYKHSKGAIQFPLNKKIPFSLIHKIAIFRIKEILATHS